METPYKSVSFKKHEIITRDEIQQLETDYQWINDNTPRGRLFTNKAKSRDNMLVIICGKQEIHHNKKSSTASASVKFGRAFAPGCNPNVTVGVNSDFQRTIFCVVNGPGGTEIPDSTGFDILIAMQDDPNTKKEEVLKKKLFIHWSAMGYRTSDMNEF